MGPPAMPGSYLVVETTNRCSLACVHCSVSEEAHPHHEKTGYIDPSLVEGLVADLIRVGARFDTLIPFWLGEPLLHPHFSHLWRLCLRAAARHGTFGKVEVHTNATHLTEDRVRAVLNDADVPQVWHFSLDAVSKETYLSVKGRDRAETVTAQIDRFLELKAARRARWPRPVFQFIVGSNNVSEVPAFRARWEGACKRLGVPVRAAAGHVPSGEDAIVFFRQRDCPTPAMQEQENRVFREAMAQERLALPPAAAKGEQVAAENLAPCSGFWKSPVVSWQGDVTVCTRDNLLENRLGNLRERPFSELWWGRGMTGRRARVARGDYEGLPPCATCFIPRSLNHAALAPEDIARQARWDAARGAP